MQLVFVLLLTTLLFSGCAYRHGLRQGAVLNEKAVTAVQVGMTREEVYFLLGPPSIVDPADSARVFYAYYPGDVLDEKRFADDIKLPVTPKKILQVQYKQGRVSKLSSTVVQEK